MLRIFNPDNLPSSTPVLPPLPNVDEKLLWQIDFIFSNEDLPMRWQKVEAIAELIMKREYELLRDRSDQV